MTHKEQVLNPDLQKILCAFQEKSGLRDVDYEIKERSTGNALIIQMANPTERFYKILEESLSSNNEKCVPTATIKKRAPSNRIQSPEASFFLKALAEVLNVNRHSFGSDFFSRYTRSVSNAEAQITALANHVVYGRRGAGKSSLLLYALRSRENEERPSAWIDIQGFAKRADTGVVVEIICSVLEQLKDVLSVPLSVVNKLDTLKNDADLTEDKIRKAFSEIRAFFPGKASSIFIFLDDFHLLDLSVQAKTLGFLYSVSRGNKVFIKISAIETLSEPWIAASHTGMQVPHDMQAIHLDYNLTMPDRAKTHIEEILNAHATYCGLPSVRYLCTNDQVLLRLVWVSAGVPRDALNLFSQAITKATIAGRARVSVTDINVAASEMVSQKARDLKEDITSESTETSLETIFERIKNFCIKQNKKNAFLVEIGNESLVYQASLKLIDLRLVHVISEGITIGTAGRKYLALILDYGFYTGIRAAQSVDLFNKQTGAVKYKDLRGLPVFKEKS